VSTNGLFPASVAAALVEAGVNRASVSLATANPAQYDELMRPEAGAGGRGLRSSTFRLNVSRFCGIRWLHDFPPVY
jgi:hypothetical protein